MSDRFRSPRIQKFFLGSKLNELLNPNSNLEKRISIKPINKTVIAEAITDNMIEGADPFTEIKWTERMLGIGADMDVMLPYLLEQVNKGLVKYDVATNTYFPLPQQI